MPLLVVGISVLVLLLLMTKFYGLFIAVPIGALIALVWPRLPFVKAMNPSIPQGLVSERVFEDEEMPALGWSLGVVLFPVALIVGAAVTDMATSGSSPFLHFVAFTGSAPIALLLTLILAVWAFGPRIGRSLADVSASCNSAAQATAVILLVIGAGGAFKNVLVEGGISDYIKDQTHGWSISPIVLAWLIAVILRVALGSATVAVVTDVGRGAAVPGGQRGAPRDDGARRVLWLHRLLARQRPRILAVQGVLQPLGRRGDQGPHQLYDRARRPRSGRCPGGRVGP